MFPSGSAVVGGPRAIGLDSHCACRVSVLVGWQVPCCWVAVLVADNFSRINRGSADSGVPTVPPWKEPNSPSGRTDAARFKVVFAR